MLLLSWKTKRLKNNLLLQFQFAPKVTILAIRNTAKVQINEKVAKKGIRHNGLDMAIASIRDLADIFEVEEVGVTTLIVMEIKFMLIEAIAINPFQN